MNRYTKCLNHEFSHRQGCIFTDFHVHEEVQQVQMFMGRLPPNPNRRICRLQNRNDFFLTISKSGEIMGTKNVTDAFNKIQIISMGENLISFRPKDSSKYLAVDKNGNMFLTSKTKDVKIDQFIFEEKMDDKFYVSYKLKAYRGKRAWYLSIDEQGHVRMVRCLPGTLQADSQFFLIQLKKRHSL
ncbi:fibroblast growth factor 10-like [Dendronephthya gigantea]|uniref:fibroblast growth factor 10-like n=1 Tax=Dendronephthya gigantea TaxID=151771 RepID=UPI00106D4ACE|nr:fibroblast growth factor 10-like [Dendronephthya gigantea]